MGLLAWLFGKKSAVHSGSDVSEGGSKNRERRLVPLGETSERWKIATMLYQETRQRLIAGKWSKDDAYPVLDGFRAMSADEIFALVERLNAAQASGQDVNAFVNLIEAEVKEIAQQAAGKAVPVPARDDGLASSGSADSERWSRVLAGIEMIVSMDRNHLRNDAKGVDLLRRVVAQCEDPTIVKRARKILEESGLRA